MTGHRAKWVGLLTVVGVVAAYSAVRAGLPAPGGDDPPMLFSGSLSDNGIPLTGLHQISLSLWQANDTTVSTNRICDGAAQGVTVDAGNFQIQVDPTCVDLFSRYRQIYSQLTVDGTAFPLQQVGSVPFALRSMAEPSNGSRLVRHRTLTYTDDGYRGDIAYGNFTDKARNEDCSAMTTSEGGQSLSRCLPAAAGMNEDQYDPTGVTTSLPLYADAACSTTYATDGVRYYRSSYSYVADVDVNAARAVTAIYPVTTEGPLNVYEFWPPNLYPGKGCTLLGTTYRYTLGAPIALTEFAQFKTATE